MIKQFSKDGQGDMFMLHSSITQEELEKVGNSMVGTDTVIMRLPQKFRPHSLQDTRVVDFVGSNPVTNNDIVLNF